MVLVDIVSHEIKKVKHTREKGVYIIIIDLYRKNLAPGIGYRFL